MPTTDTPTLTLCADLVTELKSEWGPTGADSADWAFFVQTADSEDPALAITTGRKVTICPTLENAYSYEPATRGEDLYTHRISVLTEKRYQDPGDPPRAWIKGEVDWVYTYIVLGFDWDFRTGSIPTFNRKLVTLSSNVQLFDIEDLLEHGKLFSSQVDIVFQELIDA